MTATYDRAPDAEHDQLVSLLADGIPAGWSPASYDANGYNFVTTRSDATEIAVFGIQPGGSGLPGQCYVAPAGSQIADLVKTTPPSIEGRASDALAERGCRLSCHGPRAGAHRASRNRGVWDWSRDRGRLRDPVCGCAGRSRPSHVVAKSEPRISRGVLALRLGAAATRRRLLCQVPRSSRVIRVAGLGGVGGRVCNGLVADRLVVRASAGMREHAATDWSWCGWGSGPAPC